MGGKEPNYLSHHMLPPTVCISRKLGLGAQQGLDPGTLLWNVGVSRSI